MLKKLDDQDFDLYIDIAYQISMDLTKTSFPVYTDRIKTKEDFIRRAQIGMHSKSEELLIFVENGSSQGLIHYYVLEEDKYIGVCFISIAMSYAKALEELLDHWRTKYSGYQWDLYFPEQNVDALSYMTKNGYESEEQSVVEVLLFDEYELQEENNKVIPITLENYHMFSEIHTLYEADIYWTSERILKDFEHWNVFVLPHKGAIYNNGTGTGKLEIFGIDICEEKFSADTSRSLLVSCLNHAKRHHGQSMYFFAGPNMKEIAASLGFHCVTAAHFFSGIAE